MKRTLLLGIAPLGLALACATSRPADVHANDALITSKVEAKLAADPQTSPLEIDVDTLDGRVRLSGAVETEAERRDAERLARETDGVKSVNNELEIGDLDIGEHVNDTWLETKLASLLAADPEVDSRNIDVDVLDGQVTLSGLVTSERARTEAERIARTTDGVRSVRNEIRVR